MQEYPEGERIIKALHYHDSELWIGTLGSILKVTRDKAGNAVITPVEIIDNRLKDVKDMHITSITHDSQGNILFGSRHGIYSKSENESVFTLAKKNSFVERIIADKTGNIWVVSRDGIYCYPVLQQQMKNYFSEPVIVRDSGFQQVQFRSIIPVTENLLAAISDSDVFFIRIQNNVISLEKIRFSDPRFFENNRLKSIMADHTLNIWLTSAMDGVARFDLNDKKIYKYPLLKQNAPEKNFIQAIVKDNRNRLWIGSREGCFLIDLQKRETKRIGVFNGYIMGLLKDREGNIWCTSFDGIHYFPDANENQGIPLLKHPRIPDTVFGFDGPYELCEDSRNGIIWIGIRSGLLQIRKTKGDFAFKHYEKQQYGISNISNITTLYPDSVNNVMLIGTTSAGVYEAGLTDRGDIESIRTLRKQLPDDKNNHIWKLFKASDGTIYEGTDSGLNKIVKDTAGYCETRIETGDLRLRTYKIAGIVEDHKKNLWLSTGAGLLSYNPVTGEVKEFLDSDGLASRILTEGTFYDEDTEQLFLGSVKGLNIIELSSLKDNETAPVTVIHNLKINNKPVYPGVPFNNHLILTEALSYTPAVRLRHDENNFSVDFASLHYSNPQKNRFRYKLEGLHEEWINIGNSHTANFTNLSPGNYTLWVKSANADGIWEKEPARLLITITPVCWRTTGACIIYAITFAVIAVFTCRYITKKRIYKQQLFIEQLENRKKIEISEIKLKYHTNITHELRTLLSLIVAPVEELVAKSCNDEFVRSRLRSIRTNTNRLLELIGQMLDYRKVITGNYTLRIKKHNLYKKLRSIKDDFSNLALLKNIMFELYYDSSIDYCWCDIEIVGKICYNLLSNAIKYTPEGGKIYMYVSTNADYSRVTLSVEDTGTGIDENETGKIFERFYQVPDSPGGTGIGLHICKHLINLHNGTINVKSRKNEGSIFTVEFPITPDAYPVDCVFSDTAGSATEQIADKPVLYSDVEEVPPLILVIEDNNELRKYIVSLLSGNAKAIEAENGEAGYNLAVNNIPDLIVSDIMMPVMDGIELTRKCKNNLLTSHIPVILLTAKDTVESEIEGLQYGADDYICKPFNPQSLKLKIKNLIRLTRKDRKEDLKEKPSLNERDQSFITGFEKIVLENLSAPDFNMDALCRIMGVSRMQIYRKTMAILHKKPSQFIKEIKMKEAFKRIKIQGYNISETMNETGYTNYTHFTRLFVEINGITPRKLLGLKEDPSK
jgi:DNA-binding response OmpR family regulator/ligand-binding sensor domain-containing protein/nitrogen-specific signal transduction histidine kinase